MPDDGGKGEGDGEIRWVITGAFRANACYARTKRTEIQGIESFMREERP